MDSGSSCTAAVTTRSARRCASTASRTPIVGVLPADFRFLDEDVRLWVPLAFSAEEKSDDSRHSNNWSMVARLKPGATLDAGAAAD